MLPFRQSDADSPLNAVKDPLLPVRLPQTSGRFLACALEMTLCDNRGSVERLTHEMSGV